MKYIVITAFIIGILGSCAKKTSEASTERFSVRKIFAPTGEDCFVIIDNSDGNKAISGNCR